MAQLIAISGTHGSGKSTLIKELSSVKYYVPAFLEQFSDTPSLYIDDFKVSRTVQAQFGMTLAEAEQDIDTLIRFQEAIIEQKLNHDEKLKERPEDFVIVERSLLDVFTYASIWCQNNREQLAQHLHWYTEYHSRCLKGQMIYDGVVFVPSHSEVPFEAEANRAPLETRELFEEIFTNTLIRSMEWRNELLAFTVVKVWPLHLRVAQVLNFLNTL